MKNLLNPKWLLVIGTLPVIILFLIGIGDYNIIKTLLDDTSKQLWFTYGIVLFILSTIQLTYSIISIVKRKRISIIYALITLIVYTTFLYHYTYAVDDIIPFNIPRWMLSGNLMLYAGTFLMPTLAHALFIIVIKITPKEKKHNPWVSFCFAIVIPFLSYLFVQIILPLAKRVDMEYNEHVILISVISSLILFLTFLIRTIYILSLKKGQLWSKYQLVWKIPITLIFPVLGLAVNQGFLINNFSSNTSGLFGDFNGYWFIGIAILNGIVLCLPKLKHKYYSISLFVLKCITFTYTLYFFIVFLPFLPLSIIAIIVFGLGFLMLTPLVLFIIHIQELSKDYLHLQSLFNKRQLIILAIAGISVIPACISINFLNDRHTLYKALDYVYNPDYSKNYAINKWSLKNTIHTVIDNKERSNDFILDSQTTPYLSPFFNWLVLDNLTLSDKKINAVQQIFFNEKPISLRQETIRNDNVNISNISSNSTYNTTDQTWTSWIDLEITNATNNRFSEYATTINLPDGCWINDYYLYVGDKKEKGILAEKKSAMWVFSQIRNTNKDPGILYYLTGNKVAFRVFPFAKNEVRKTEIQFIHKDPVTLSIDNNTVVLGDTSKTTLPKSITKNESVAYISSKDKQNLQNINRTPYYHFIVDISKDKDTLINDYKKTISNFTKQHINTMKNARVSFANTYSNTMPFNDWETALENQTFEGGFYLENAIKNILFKSYEAHTTSYPVIIVISNTMDNAIIDKDFSDFKITYPDNPLFYHLNEKEQLNAHNLNFTSKTIAKENAVITLNNSVLAWPDTANTTAYLPNNNQPSIILKSSIFKIDENTIKPSHWDSGLMMQGKWISNTLHPEHAEKDWNTLVKYSFMSKIMSPLTSYLVVENEAQKAILKKKQDQVLSGKKILDLNEDTQRMSEPGLLLLCTFLILFVLIKRRFL